MPDPVASDYSLTLEQQVELEILTRQVEHLSEAQIKDLLLSTSRLLLQKDNVIRTLIQWKSNGPQVSPR